MHEVIRLLVALMNERIVHVDHFDLPIRFGQFRHASVVVPDRFRRSPHVGFERADVRCMQITDCCREHQNIARTLA
jgi:hypothetical protein